MLQLAGMQRQQRRTRFDATEFARLWRRRNDACACAGTYGSCEVVAAAGPRMNTEWHVPSTLTGLRRIERGRRRPSRAADRRFLPASIGVRVDPSSAPRLQGRACRDLMGRPQRRASQALPVDRVMAAEKSTRARPSLLAFDGTEHVTQLQARLGRRGGDGAPARAAAQMQAEALGDDACAARTRRALVPRRIPGGHGLRVGAGWNGQRLRDLYCDGLYQ